MNTAGRRTITLEIVVALTFALVVVALGASVALPIPLYSELRQRPNVPHLPLLPLIAGIVAVVAVSRVSGALLLRALTGVALGTVAAAFVGLVDAAAIPFHDPYFTTPYRAYGLLYLAAATFLGIGFLWHALRRGSSVMPRSDALALVATAFAAGASAVAVGDLAPGSVVLAAGAAAVAVAETLRGRALSLRLSERTVVFALLLVALGLRLVFGLQALARTGPGMAFAVASDDGDSYYTLASKLAADPGAIGDVLGALAFPPGYTLFVASLLALGRTSLVTVIVAQAVLAAVAGAIVFAMARDLAGARVGFVALGLFALDGNLVQNEATLTAEALLIPLVLASLWCFARYGRERRARWIIAAATALAGVFVTRNLVAFPLFVSAILWLTWSRRSWGTTTRDAGVLVLAIALAATPIAVASAIREGAPRVTTQLASVAWDFDGGDSTISNNFLVGRGIRPFTDPAGSFARIAADPLPVLGFLLRAAPQRLSTLLFFTSYGLSDPLVVVNSIAYPNAFGDLVSILRLVGLAVAVVLVVRRRAWRLHPELVLIACYVLFYCAVFTLLFPPYHAFRYRIPIEPLRFIAEAAGLIVLASAAARAWRARERGAAPRSAPGTM